VTFIVVGVAVSRNDESSADTATGDKDNIIARTNSNITCFKLLAFFT
jgi:hypothetical protein